MRFQVVFALVVTLQFCHHAAVAARSAPEPWNPRSYPPLDSPANSSRGNRHSAQLAVRSRPRWRRDDDFATSSQPASDAEGDNETTPTASLTSTFPSNTAAQTSLSSSSSTTSSTAGSTSTTSASRSAPRLPPSSTAQSSQSKVPQPIAASRTITAAPSSGLPATFSFPLDSISISYGSVIYASPVTPLFGAQNSQTSDAAPPAVEQHPKSLSLGIGILIGALCVCALVIPAFFSYRWWRRRQLRKAWDTESYSDVKRESRRFSVQSVFRLPKGTRRVIDPLSPLPSSDRSHDASSTGHPELSSLPLTPPSASYYPQPHSRSTSHSSRVHLHSRHPSRSRSAAAILPPLDLSRSATLSSNASHHPNGEVEFEIRPPPRISEEPSTSAGPYAGIAPSPPSDEKRAPPTSPDANRVRRSILKAPRFFMTNPASPPPGYASAPSTPSVFRARWSRISALPVYQPPTPGRRRGGATTGFDMLPPMPGPSTLGVSLQPPVLPMPDLGPRTSHLGPRPTSRPAPNRI